MEGCLLIMISSPAHRILCTVLSCIVPRVRVPSVRPRLDAPSLLPFTSPRMEDVTNSTRLIDRTASSFVESPSRISYMPKPGLLHLRYEPTGELGTFGVLAPCT